MSVDRFLYKNEKPALTLQNIQSFFKVANTYHIMELKKSCDDFVESLLDRNNDYFSDRNSTDTLWELFLAVRDLVKFRGLSILISVSP